MAKAKKSQKVTIETIVKQSRKKHKGLYEVATRSELIALTKRIERLEKITNSTSAK